MSIEIDTENQMKISQATLGALALEYERACKLHTSASLAALVEEIGEVAKDMQEGRDPSTELIQVAVVALRLVEQRRGK